MTDYREQADYLARWEATHTPTAPLPRDAVRLVALADQAARHDAAHPVLHPADPLATDDRVCRCGHGADDHAHHSTHEHCTRCGRELCRAFRPLGARGGFAVTTALLVPAAFLVYAAWFALADAVGPGWASAVVLVSAVLLGAVCWIGAGGEGERS